MTKGRSRGRIRRKKRTGIMQSSLVCDHDLDYVNDSYSVSKYDRCILSPLRFISLGSSLPLPAAYLNFEAGSFKPLSEVWVLFTIVSIDGPRRWYIFLPLGYFKASGYLFIAVNPIFISQFSWLAIFYRPVTNVALFVKFLTARYPAPSLSSF